MSFHNFNLNKSLASKTSFRYNATFGTDPNTAKTGWAVLSLKTGRRQTFVGPGGNDSNNGYSIANRKLTLRSALQAFVTGWVAGDQLVFYGGADYIDDGVPVETDGIALANFPGFSSQFPTAFLCCDPNDPANQSKYGRMFGRARARIIFNAPIAGHNSFSCYVSNPAFKNYAFQGIIFDAQEVGGYGIGFVGRHDNLMWENCSFFSMGITHDGLSNNPDGRSQNILFRRCSAGGMWAPNGNASGFYSHFTDGSTCEGIAFIKCGHKFNYHRDNAGPQTGVAGNGGPYYLGHAQYHSAYNINGHFSFCVYGDSASDGLGMRGDAEVMCVLQIDDPIVGQLTGFSGGENYMLEAPDGRTVRLRDHVAMGGGDIALPNLPRGGGYQIDNAKLVTVENAALFDNPKNGSGRSLNHLLNYNPHAFDAQGNIAFNQVDQTLVLKSVRMYNFSDFIMPQNPAFNPYPWKLRYKFSDLILDPHTVDSTSPEVTGTNITVHSGAVTYPNAKTRAQVYALGGFSCRNDWFNWLLEYPHLAEEWAKVGVTIGLRSLGLDPITFFGTEVWPDRSGLPAPTLFYPLTLNALTLSATPITGVASSGTIVGFTRGSKISGTGIPAGMTVDQFAGTWTYNGTAFSHGSMTLTENWPGTTNDNRQSVIAY